MLPIRQSVLKYVSFNDLDDKIVGYFMKPEKVVIARPKDSIPNDSRRSGRGHLTFRSYQCLKVPCRILAFLLTSFLAVCSYGSGSFGIETIAILGYLTWNTLDVIDAKVSNLHLIDPPESEMSWGFGQVLPMVLLATIVFSALDVLGGERQREKMAAVLQ